MFVRNRDANLRTGSRTSYMKGLSYVQRPVLVLGIVYLSPCRSRGKLGRLSSLNFEVSQRENMGLGV